MDLENEIPVKLSELLELLEDIDDCQRGQVNDGNGDTNCDPAVLSPIVTAGIGGVALSTQNHVKARLRGKRIRKVGSVPYSTDLQRRRRTELISLRAEAQELEWRLAKFQHTNMRDTRLPTSQEEQGKWRSDAIIARKEREQAESTNRELKEILSSRLRVFASIEQLLKSCDVLKNYRHSLSQSGTANLVLETISDSLEQMLVQADSVFPALDNYLTVALRTRHEVCGTLGDTCARRFQLHQYLAQFQNPE
ncbi:hypothetical protein V7S43_003786 [Phytophthora oleae]|uniref:Uncharacterized protein n=1 Tax=Phytophthora oleae TaxID=2107226 RepID=A0ABD3G062_9STRA